MDPLAVALRVNGRNSLCLNTVGRRERFQFALARKSALTPNSCKKGT
jgi:hypothetical protein